MSYTFDQEENFALLLDSQDPLSKYRDRFYIPENNTIYLDGNSLGLSSKDAELNILRVIDEWKKMGIRGWLEPEKPWFHFGERLGAMIAPLVGAKPEEVVATGTTTVNLHSLVSTFYHPQGKKTKILANELEFPTDIYALKSQILLKGLDPIDHLVRVPSEDGRNLNENTIVESMTDEIALILLSSALYRSGQLLDIPYLTQEAHKRDIPIGWDCCHSVGALPHFFHDWDVDFAFWCSYKYLNSGPGSTAFLYINKKHFQKLPGLTGWFGNVKERQFEMSHDFEHAKSAGGWQMSSSNIFCSAPIEGSLKIFLEAGIDNIRKKSLKMTSYLIYLIDEILSKSPYNFKVGTPRDPEKRTGHVALEHDENAFEINELLMKQNIVTDFRYPNVIRIAPIALYNRYHEVWQTIQTIKDIIDQNKLEEYKNL